MLRSSSRIIFSANAKPGTFGKSDKFLTNTIRSSGDHVTPRRFHQLDELIWSILIQVEAQGGIVASQRKVQPASSLGTFVEIF